LRWSGPDYQDVQWLLHTLIINVASDHKPARDFVPSCSNSDFGQSFKFSPIDSSAVVSLHEGLYTGKAMGPDGISARFLKADRSLESGVIPSNWKLSNVTPVHKGGSVNDPGNYRPISVVSVVAKLLEKIVASQLSDYFEHYYLLSDYQGAYRRGKSTEQLLLVTVDAIVQAIDDKNVTFIAFLDLRKAFDSLDHVILL